MIDDITVASGKNEIHANGSELADGTSQDRHGVQSKSSRNESTERVDSIFPLEEEKGTQDEFQIPEEVWTVAAEELKVACQEASDRNFFSLNYLEMEKKYPVAVKECFNWFKSKSPTGAFTKSDAVGTFLYAARLLYDFLDVYDVPLSIFKKEDAWAYSITDSEIVSPINSRVQAEVEGFDYAFYTLNEILKEQ